ncbi:MAG: radical SAM protein [Candidatus Cloacimonetes bacterium]|nr:radical SAM protein [Candidatus Cloacimonadota bacterium]
MKHLFGPVPSRRLGMSLGVDLVPHKVCSFNCIYCEVGRTTKRTIERKEYIPINEVITELASYLDQKPKLDYITFSGAGEPTLNSSIGKVVSFIKENYTQYKLALITNSSLLWRKEVRKEIRQLDLILPSLDAVSEDVFQKVNNPAQGLSAELIVEGLVKFNHEFDGEMWLEIFIVPNINDTKLELELIKKTIIEINPAKIQLNTLDRPGSENWVKPESKKSMKDIVKLLQPLKVEIIAKFTTQGYSSNFKTNITDQILSTIRRRPCTSADLAEVLSLSEAEIKLYLKTLIIEKKISSENHKRGTFYWTR